MREYTSVSRYILYARMQGICAPQVAGGVTRYRIVSSVEKEPGLNTVFVTHIPGIIYVK